MSYCLNGCHSEVLCGIVLLSDPCDAILCLVYTRRSAFESVLRGFLANGHRPATLDQGPFIAVLCGLQAQFLLKPNHRLRRHLCAMCAQLRRFRTRVTDHRCLTWPSLTPLRNRIKLAPPQDLDRGAEGHCSPVVLWSCGPSMGWGPDAEGAKAHATWPSPLWGEASCIGSHSRGNALHAV